MAESSKTTVAFLGLGAMGFGMATNLVKMGYGVRGYDVWGPTLERFEREGGESESFFLLFWFWGCLGEEVD